MRKRSMYSSRGQLHKFEKYISHTKVEFRERFVNAFDGGLVSMGFGYAFRCCFFLGQNTKRAYGGY